MERIKIHAEDGKTRDERESCFPMAKSGEKDKKKGVCI
jgi:hypothetical protein